MQIANLALVHETCIYSMHETLLALRLEEETFHHFKQCDLLEIRRIGTWVDLTFDNYILVFGFCLFFWEM